MIGSFNRDRSTPISRTLRALARLLGYPDAQLRAHLGELRDALHRECAVGLRRMAGLDALLDTLGGSRPLDVEAAYVELFDRGRGASLHLFEHVHGDSRDRGPAMVDLVKTYEATGLLMGPHELPDHLTVVLEFASTQPPEQARAFLGEITHIVRAIHTTLEKRGSPYAHVLAAVLEIAGEPVQPVAVPVEPPIDETWAEPAVFAGCDTAGQARPGQPQPVRVMPRGAPHTPSAAPPNGARA